MRWRILDESPGRRTVGVALEIGDQAVASLLRLATELDLGASVVTGVGGFHGVRLAYFAGCGLHPSRDPEHPDFVENRLDDQFEVLSLAGNLSREEGTRAQHLHAHVVLGRKDATTMGGHLIEANVHPTMELIIAETGGQLARGVDEKTGLVVLKP